MDHDSGHRSRLPIFGFESWERLNQLKGREPWQPFAPVVEEDFHEFFHGPLNSPFMLYTHQVRSKKLPAITHFDHSARVQVILKSSKKEDAEAFRNILHRLKQHNVPPVIINTSFNGPGSIIETISDVIHEARSLRLKHVVVASELYNVS